MNSVVRNVKMNACRKATKSSRNVRAMIETMLEHLKDEQYAQAKANLDGMLATAGIEWSS